MSFVDSAERNQEILRRLPERVVSGWELFKRHIRTNTSIAYADALAGTKKGVMMRGGDPFLDGV